MLWLCSAAPISTRLYINSQNRCRRYFFKNFVTAKSPKFILSSLSISLSSPPRAMAVGSCALSSDDVIVKSPTDRRLYRFIQLPNGLCALLVHDPEIYSGEPSVDGEMEDEDEDEEEDEDEDEEDSEEEGSEEDDDEEDEGEEVNEPKGSAQKKAAAAMCVGIGSFADPYEAQGLAHFLGFGDYILQLFRAFK